VQNEAGAENALEKLDSWKAIASYLGRDVTTVQRWEKREGLPVHRHVHDKQGSVYAFRGELDRWRELRDSRESAAPELEGVPGARPLHGWPLWWAYTIPLAVGVLALVWWFTWRWDSDLPPQTGVVARSTIPLPTGAVSAYALAFSPDGTHLAYIGLTDRLGPTRLYLKAMDQLASTAVAGTEQASRPFFSPDGRWIGFFAQGKLKKVAVSGGAPVSICDAPQPRGGTWGPGGRIVFAPLPHSGLFMVHADGGEPIPLTTPDRARFERSHREPSFLPEGDAVLFTVHRATHDTFDDADVEILIIAGRERRLVLQGGMNPTYVPSGHLLYGRRDALMAVPFEPGRMATRATPVAVVEGILNAVDSGRTAYTVSSNGALVYAPGGSSVALRQLVWVTRSGAAEPLNVPPKPYLYPRISPDGRHVVVEVDTGSPQLWVLDLARGSLTRRPLMWDAEEPSWTPRGDRLTFGWSSYSAEGASRASIYSQPLDGSSPPEHLLPPPLSGFTPYGWSPDARYFLYGVLRAQSDIWLASGPQGNRVASPLIASAADERAAHFSPDGRHIAFVSDETGRSEVYVADFPRVQVRRQVSVDGGTQPVWSRDGSELFYRAERGRMMAASVNAEPPSPPKVLFTGTYFGGLGAALAQYDVAIDGRFLMSRPAFEQNGPTHLVLVSDWFHELRERSPAR
jgi:serine/threonine-protein kinase